MSMYRLTGTAGRVHTREFPAKEDRAAFSMRSQDVDIAQFISTRIDLADGEAPMPAGTSVDVAVEVTARGGYLRTEIKGDWPKPSTAERARPLAAATS